MPATTHLGKRQLEDLVVAAAAEEEDGAVVCGVRGLIRRFPDSPMIGLAAFRVSAARSRLRIVLERRLLAQQHRPMGQPSSYWYNLGVIASSCLALLDDVSSQHVGATAGEEKETDEDRVCAALRAVAYFDTALAQQRIDPELPADAIAMAQLKTLARIEQWEEVLSRREGLPRDALGADAGLVIARALLETGSRSEARTTLESLLGEEGECSHVYIRARLLLAMAADDVSEVRDCLRRAVLAVPCSHINERDRRTARDWLKRMGLLELMRDSWVD